jgi:hypothetical protein
MQRKLSCGRVTRQNESRFAARMTAHDTVDCRENADIYTMLPRSWCVVQFLQANIARSTRRGRYWPRHASGPMLQEVSMRESPAIPQAMQQHGGIAKNAATCGRDQTTGKQDVIDKKNLIDKENLAKATPNPDEARLLINRAQELRDFSSSN